MNHNLLIPFLIFILIFVFYIIFEYVFRQSVLKSISTKRDISLPFITSFKWQPKWTVYLILSPGLWVSENCKEFIKNEFPHNIIYKRELANFIKASNFWNFIFSLSLLVVTLFREDILPEINNSIFLAIVMWRYISRSFEIAIAFVRDVLSSDSKSSLDNHARMKLAITSYFEIFIYSAAFYSAFSCKGETIFEPILTSLFVGTLTNISGALELLINCCEYDLFYKSLLLLSVYLQVFATLSLIFFGFAGYLGRVKSNIKKSTHSSLMRAYRKSRARYLPKHR